MGPHSRGSKDFSCATLQFILSGATAQVGHSHILTVTEAALYQSVLHTPTSFVWELRGKFDGTKIRPHPPRSSAAIHHRITGLLRTLTVECTLHAKSNAECRQVLNGSEICETEQSLSKFPSSVPPSSPSHFPQFRSNTVNWTPAPVIRT